MGFQPPYSVAQQQTMPLPAPPSLPMPPPGPINVPTPPPAPVRKKRIRRTIAIILVFALAISIYLIWNNASPTSTASSSSPTIAQQNFGNSTSTTNGKNTTVNAISSNGSILAYIVGAVKHPGVYTLPTGARVYQLLQAAGGPLPKANLVALNLAASLTDGEEVYVTLIGEIPPTYMGGVPGSGTSTSSTPTSGQLININTASATELRQALHISSTTAQNIVNYRLQHGPYTSVNDLLNVVSRSTFDKIKNLVTV